ncbi:hypothetical protein LCGC14_2464030, partial [marine sediment metagenome]
MAIGSFTSITSGQTDADSAVDATLLDSYRTNQDHFRAYLGGNNYTPAEDHNHDDTNSKGITLALSPSIANDDASAAPYTDTDNTFVTKGVKYYFYVASTGSKTLQILYRGKNSDGGGSWYGRTQIDGATNTTGVSNNNTSFANETESYDATALSVGWHYLELQMHGTFGVG